MNRPQHTRAAIIRLSAQVDSSPEAQLMLGIVCSAIYDLEEENHKDSAKAYLMGEMLHAQMIGLEPDWIRATLKELRLLRA